MKKWSKGNLLNTSINQAIIEFIICVIAARTKCLTVKLRLKKLFASSIALGINDKYS